MKPVRITPVPRQEIDVRKLAHALLLLAQQRLEASDEAQTRDQARLELPPADGEGTPS